MMKGEELRIETSYRVKGRQVLNRWARSRFCAGARRPTVWSGSNLRRSSEATIQNQDSAGEKGMIWGILTRMRGGVGRKFKCQIGWQRL